MQGVQKFGDYGIEIRMKMKTTPGEQFTMRRKAFVIIKKTFEENGISIPFPTVHVQEGKSAAGAAVQSVMAAKQPETPI
jgi:small-conductance mechanosensitive channel